VQHDRRCCPRRCWLRNERLQISPGALPAIAEAVDDQIEVLLDGGIRRGTDVVKAVALGARAVRIGRDLWGLAANGQAGVENVLDVLRGGIDSALMGLGRASIHDLVAGDVLVPPGFTRTLGAEA
jgi:pre-mycofactocin synthase